MESRAHFVKAIDRWNPITTAVYRNKKQGNDTARRNNFRRRVEMLIGSSVFKKAQDLLAKTVDSILKDGPLDLDLVTPSVGDVDTLYAGILEDPFRQGDEEPTRF